MESTNGKDLLGSLKEEEDALKAINEKIKAKDELKAINIELEKQYRIINKFNCSAYIRHQMTWFEHNILHFRNSECHDVHFLEKNTCFCTKFLKLKVKKTVEVANALHECGFVYESTQEPVVEQQTSSPNGTCSKRGMNTHENERNNEMKRFPYWIWFLFHVRNCCDHNNKALIGLKNIVIAFEKYNIEIPHLAYILEDYLTNGFYFLTFSSYWNQLQEEMLHRPEDVMVAIQNCLLYLQNFTQSLTTTKYYLAYNGDSSSLQIAQTARKSPPETFT